MATAPVVNSIFFDSPARGDTYKLAETIELLVEFHRAVTVTGSPQLALTIGTQTRQAATPHLGGTVLSALQLRGAEE